MIRIKLPNLRKNGLAAKLMALSLVVTFLIASFFVAFSNNLQQNLIKQANDYLQENSNRAVDTLSKKVDDIFAVLDTAEKYIEVQGPLNSDQVLQMLHDQATKNFFSSMVVSLPDGTSFCSENQITSNVKDCDYFQTALKGKKAISNLFTPKEDGMPSIVFAIPIYKNNKIAGVLSCVYSSQLFRELLSTTAFNGEGRILLIQNDGTTIIGSSKLQQGGNYFAAMASAVIQNNFSVEKLSNRFKNGESGFLQYTYLGEPDCASFRPVCINNWYVVSIVPLSYIQSQSTQISGNVFILVLAIIAVLLLFLFYIFHSERKNAKALLDSNQKFEALADNVPGGVLRCDAEEATLDFVSNGCLRLFNCTRDQFHEQYRNKFENIIYEKDRERTMKHMSRQLQHGHHVSVEFRILDSDGNLHWIFHRGRVVTEANKKKWQYVVLTDITKLKETQEELRQSFERYRIVIEQSDSALYEYNCKDDSAYVSENFKKMFGYELSQQNFSDALIKQNVIHADDVDLLLKVYQQILDGAQHNDINLRIRKSDGTFLWCKMQTTTVFDNLGAPVRVLAKVTDISAEKAETESLLVQAQRDPLTGFYNKATTQTLIDQCLKQEGPSKVSALFILDLDHFKQANDTFGHLFGDSVLVKMSSKIKKLFRSSDIIGRVGGDEFIIFLKNIADENAIAEKAREVCDAVSAVSMNDSSNYTVSCSIGISVFPKDGSHYLQLFKKADKALYYSKNHGKNGYAFYDSEDMAAHHYSKNS